MTVVDAHQHLWDLEKVAYPWLTPEFGTINRTYTYAEAEPELAAAGIDRTVLVQAADSYDDTEAMLAVAREWPRVAGVVAWAPLTRPQEFARVVERYAADPHVVGIRHLVHDEPDPDWLMQRSVLDSLGLLAEADLTFDVVAVLPRHLEHVPTIASLHPGLRLVVDHLGKPPIASGGLSPWRELLTTAAAHDNVFAKISGLNTAAVWDNWSAADLQPYIDVALNAFGPGRLMFGGDWPVALLAGDYSAVVRETRAALSSLSPGEQEAIWGGTAIETYKLDV